MTLSDRFSFRRPFLRAGVGPDSGCDPLAAAGRLLRRRGGRWLAHVFSFAFVLGLALVLVLPVAPVRASAVQEAQSAQSAQETREETASVTNDDPRRADETPPPPAFGPWLERLKHDALAAGVSAATVHATLDGLTPDPKVIALDRRQPEFTQTAAEYLARRVSATRIARGREMIRAHAAELKAVAERYHVQPRFIVAIWGLETNYGRYTGGMSVVRSLATLAWDRRRSRFFRAELINALKILDAGHITPERMLGSWAGAMGQSQFMPSSFLAYAADFDGDGRRDIWTSTGDVFASIARYLAAHGWREDLTWGRAVRLPADRAGLWEKVKRTHPPKTCGRALRDHSRRLPLGEWQRLGVRRLDGSDLPARPELPASLVAPDGLEGEAYLTYANFRSILSYNCSNLYALAVGLLSDALKDEEAAIR